MTRKELPLTILERVSRPITQEDVDASNGDQPATTDDRILSRPARPVTFEQARRAQQHEEAMEALKARFGR